MSDERDGRLDRFEAEFRQWGRRSAGTAPGTAATRILARIRAGRPRARPAWGLAWAAAVALALAGSWLIGGLSPRAPSPTPTAGYGAVPLPDNVVLWWLDPETPVYFVIRPAEPGEGGR